MRRGRDDSAGQNRIDFDWCHRDRIIRDCVLAGLVDKHGDRVSMTTAKLVLSIIHSHGGGKEAWVSFTTLAGKAGKAERTVKRAVEALKKNGVLIVEYRLSPAGMPCNHYQIVWTELALLVPSRGQCHFRQRTVPVVAHKAY